MKISFKQAHSSNFCSGRTQNIKYIVIHYTANDGDTAKNNVDYYARASLKASAHYFVDENEVWQSVKEGDTAYHCGANKYVHPYCRNSNSIGIELCSRKDADGKYYFKDETIQNAVKLTKERMAKYNIFVGNVIRHYDVTGKICPAPMVNDEILWNTFKAMLTEKNKIETGNDIDCVLKWKYGITFDSVENEKTFIKELDELRADDSKVYWVFYKLANN